MLRSPWPQSIAPNQNNRCKMKSVRFNDSRSAVVFVVGVHNKDLIEVLPFDLGGKALRRLTWQRVPLDGKVLPDYNLDGFEKRSTFKT